MFITIRNLPPRVKAKDIIVLINEKCLITDVILGQIIRDEEALPTRKVTIGLADECDAAIVFRKLNGLLFQGCPLIIEDSRKKKALACHCSFIVCGLNPASALKLSLDYRNKVINSALQQLRSLSLVDKAYGPVPGELPRVKNTVQFQAPVMHMPAQQMMIPGYNAMGMMSTGFYNPVEAMMQPAVVDQQGFGFVQQPIMMTNQEPMQHPNQPIIDQYDEQQYTDQLPHQMNQPRQQLNQPHHQLNQPHHQLNQPRYQKPSRNNQAVRNRSEPNPRMYQQESRRPPYEKTQNYYGNSHVQEPYNTSAVDHATSLDWDIPSREVVLQESDPVWGTKVKKHSDTTPNVSQLETYRTMSRNEPRLDDNNFGQFAIGRQGHDINEEDYGYHEPSTHDEAYHPNVGDSFSNENYTNAQPDYENQEYSQDAMPFNRPHNPKWKPHQRNDNFRIDNRKRTYGETQHNEYQYSAVPSYSGQGNRSKRNKTDNYDNSYNSNDMEVGHGAPAMEGDFSHTCNENEFDNEFEDVATDGTPFLGFKKFKFSYKLSVAKFKQFESYMFKNLISRRFTTDVKAYNVMYAVCRLIMKKLTNELGFNFRKYAYFVLNYIQLLIEKALGDRMYNPKMWKHKYLFDAFHQTYTYAEFFVMFKKWFEYYDDKCDMRVTPKIAAMLNEPRGPKNRPYLKPIARNKPKKAVVGKPGPKLLRGQQEYDQRFNEQRRSLPNPTPAGPNVKPNAQGKPNIRAAVVFAGQKKNENNVIPEETDTQIIAAKKDMEMIMRKKDAILSIQYDTANKLIQDLRRQMDKELEKALREEMEGLNQEVLSCLDIPDKNTLTKICRGYSVNFKRSIIYRLFKLKIALTAKITFAPEEKNLSLAACSEFFNARQGKVLHTEQNIAMVLFSTNEAFKKMCDEKDVDIEGCKIQHIIPLDLDINTPEYHSAIENAIKRDNSKKILDFVFNKVYMKAHIKNDVVNMSGDEEEENQPISDAKLLKTAPNINNRTATKPNTNSNRKDIAKNQLEGDDINNKQPESEGKSVQNSNTKAKENINSQTESVSNVKIEKTSNIQTEPTLNIKTEQTSNIKTEETPNAETGETFNTDEIQTAQFDQESSNDDQSGPPSPFDGEGNRDEKIKEFLEDFEKAINENEEIFMSEDDLEDFEL